MNILLFLLLLLSLLLLYMCRILDFQDSWVSLEDWFGQKQKILVKVNADVDENTLYRTLETVLLHAMDAAEKGGAFF